MNSTPSTLPVSTIQMISAQNVSKTFPALSKGQQNHFKALDKVSFSIAAGECVALLGASGSGKSTLIRMLCGLSRMDTGSGDIRIGSKLALQNDRVGAEISDARKVTGVIFQQFNLVGQLDVLTNVLIGCLHHKSTFDVLLRRFSEAERVQALECLDMVGLGPQAYQRASTLSGGQQQRVAVARAPLKGAKVLLADEPVASLDPESARKVMDVLFGLTKELGMTLVVSLHQISIARTYCQRALGMSRGRLVYDGPIADLSEQRLKQLYGADAQELLTEEVSAPRHIHTKDISFVSA